MAKNKEKETVASATATKYTGAALAASKKYRPYIDVLTVILDTDKEYTIEEADKALNEFLARPVEEAVN